MPHTITTKFDRYRETYRAEVKRSIGFSRCDLDFFASARARQLLKLIEAILGRDPATVDVLDVGCGIGVLHRFLLPRVRTLNGVDIAPELIRIAAHLYPSAHYQAYAGPVLPFDRGRFDVAFAVNVLHHVPKDAWLGFLAEMRRAVRRDGLVVIFEHNPFNPLTRLAVRRCRFDDDCTLLRRREVSTLFPKAELRVERWAYILFFPWTWRPFADLEELLASVPIGAQYFVAGRPA